MSKKPTMTPLLTQEQFETLYKTAVLKRPIMIYFTASWCGPCQRLDWEFLQEEFPDLPVYKCDIDENKYTPGYCGIKSIPNFIMMNPAKELTQFQSSDTAKIASWIQRTLTAYEDSMTHGDSPKVISYGDSKKPRK